MNSYADSASTSGIEGAINFFTKEEGTISVLNSSFHREGQIEYGSIILGTSMVSTIIRTCKSTEAFDVTLHGTYETCNDIERGYGLLQDGEICYGYIKIQITKLTSGYLPFGI